MKTPKAFISYSWGNPSHKAWVQDLATRLRQDGIETTLDQWHAAPGDQLPAFMETAIRENDFVLMVCTRRYKEKYDKRGGGVGYEGDILQGEVFLRRNHRKFIPILREGQWEDISPSALLGTYYIDLRDGPHYEENYNELILTLHGQRKRPPAVGRFTLSSVKEEIDDRDEVDESPRDSKVRIFGMEPFEIVKASAKILRANKYAVGVVGVLAVVAAASELKLSWPYKVGTSAGVILLMVILAVFDKHIANGRESFGRPARFLVWACSITLTAVLTLGIILSSFWVLYRIKTFAIQPSEVVVPAVKKPETVEKQREGAGQDDRRQSGKKPPQTTPTPPMADVCTTTLVQSRQTHDSEISRCVLDERGHAMPGISVLCGFPVDKYTETDQSGRFTCPLPANVQQLLIKIDVSGYEPLKQEIRSDSNEPIYLLRKTTTASEPKSANTYL